MPKLISKQTSDEITRLALSLTVILKECPEGSKLRKISNDSLGQLTAEILDNWCDDGTKELNK